MQEYFSLITGFIIILLVASDFFFTTLSGNGAGFITKKVAPFADKIIKAVVKFSGRNFYQINGLFVNLITLSVWVLLVWMGLFLIYSFNPEAITNSNGRIANVFERLYFTAYVISTLGIGNFKPTSGFFEIVTSCFSFFGFIFFTSSMTYFISVSSALVNKRTFTKTILSLGNNPEQISKKLLSVNSSYAFQQLLSIQNMIDKHTVNHHAYPVVHYYTEKKPKNCFSLNLTRLDEALSIIIGSSEGKKIQEELEPLRSSISDFLQKLDESFSNSMPKVNEPIDPSFFAYKANTFKNEDLQKRRRTMEKLFKSEGLTWTDVVQ